MTLTEFEQSLNSGAPPTACGPLLVAMWHERKGDWTRAHEIAQDIEGPDAAWVHAYLHRREGDYSNAGYWYRHARREVEHGDMDDEWRTIVEELLRR